MTEECEPRSSHPPGRQTASKTETLAGTMITSMALLVLWLAALLLTDWVDSKLFPLVNGAYQAIFGALFLPALLLGIKFLRSRRGEQIESQLRCIRLPATLEIGFLRVATRPLKGFWSGIRLILIVMVLPATLAILTQKWAAPEYSSPFANLLAFALWMILGPVCMLVLLSLVAGLWPKRSDDAT